MLSATHLKCSEIIVVWSGSCCLLLKNNFVRFQFLFASVCSFYEIKYPLFSTLSPPWLFFFLIVDILTLHPSSFERCFCLFVNVWWCIKFSRSIHTFVGSNISKAGIALHLMDNNFHKMFHIMQNKYLTFKTNFCLLSTDANGDLCTVYIGICDFAGVVPSALIEFNVWI